MSLVNNKESFAGAAKRIIKKYKRAEFDSTEKTELDEALKALSEEQEAYKQANQIGDYAPGAQKQGANMQHDGLTPGSSSYIDYSDNTWGQDQSYMAPQNQVEPIEMNTSVSDLGQDNVPKGFSNNGVADPGNWSEYKTSIVPSLASGAASTLGNLYLASQVKGYEKLNNPRVTANLISLAEEREAANRHSDIASSTARRNIKNVAKTRGEYMSNLSATEAALNRNRADAQGASYQREALMNQQEKARIQQLNAQLAAQEARYNAEMSNKSKAEQRAYQAAAIEAIPQTMKDINQTRQQDALINSLGEDYGIYQQNQGFLKPRKVSRKYKKNIK